MSNAISDLRAILYDDGAPRRYAVRRVTRRFARIARQQRQREDLELGWLDIGGET